MAVINALCEELTVTVRKADGVLRLTFWNGIAGHQECLSADSAHRSGNKISGVLQTQFRGGLDEEALRNWLKAVSVTAPSLRLYFNDQEVEGPP